MKLIYLIKPPCPKCPYNLGLIPAVMNPCPQCRGDHSYRMYEIFKDSINWALTEKSTKGGEAE